MKSLNSSMGVMVAPKQILGQEMYIANRGPALDNPKAAPLVKRNREKYNGDPMSYVFSGYDVLMMYAQALEKAGTVTDT